MKFSDLIDKKNKTENVLKEKLRNLVETERKLLEIMAIFEGIKVSRLKTARYYDLELRIMEIDKQLLKSNDDIKIHDEIAARSYFLQSEINGILRRNFD